MQFRRQGNRVQVLAYRGYDKEKKRANVKLLGSFDAHSFELSGGLNDTLTDDEKKELQAHINTVRQSHDSILRRSAVRQLDSNIKIVSDCLSSGEHVSLIDEQCASRIYEGIDSLTKALRKLGYKRPPRQKAEQAGDLLGKAQG